MIRCGVVLLGREEEGEEEVFNLFFPLTPSLYTELIHVTIPAKRLC
jgi:hypothetical protein